MKELSIRALVWVALAACSGREPGGQSRLPGATRDSSASPGAVPIGSVVAFAGEIPPPGWLICDGRPLSKSAFDELFEVLRTTYGDGRDKANVRKGDFNLPDYRGQFLRGVDQGTEGPSGTDPDTITRTGPRGSQQNAGNHVGSYQSDATAMPRNGLTLETTGAHDHGLRLEIDASRDPEKRDNCCGNTVANYPPRIANYRSTREGDHTHTVSGGDRETRPKNVYVYWIIRAK
jgi:hypothetical protein